MVTMDHGTWEAGTSSTKGSTTTNEDASILAMILLKLTGGNATFSQKNEGIRVIHKYAQWSCFKGTWDAAGKRAKENIRKGEVERVRSPTAFDRFKRNLSCLSQTERMSKWEAYENAKDKRLSDKTVFTQDRAFSSYVTNDKAEYDTIRQEYEHVIFTDHDNINDTATVKVQKKFMRYAAKMALSIMISPWMSMMYSGACIHPLFLARRCRVKCIFNSIQCIRCLTNLEI